MEQKLNKAQNNLPPVNNPAAARLYSEPKQTERALALNDI